MPEPIIRAHIGGVAEISRKLQELGGVGHRKVVRGAIRQAAKPIIEDARRRVDSERIARGIKVVGVSAKPDGTVIAIVGLPGGRHDWYHGYFLERGTGPRVQKKTGRHTGSMPAKPFLRPAFDSQKNAVLERFGSEIRSRIEKVARG